jgi:multiple sugar transport system substrate-binding protein
MSSLKRALLVCVLALAPLASKAADLVVWWEEGFYPQADEAVVEIIAAFEQETGKEVELVQYPQDDMLNQAESALQAGAPPDFLFSTVVDFSIARWAYDDRLVDLEGVLGPVRDLFDTDTMEVSTLVNGRTGRRGLYALPMGRPSNHLHLWKSLLERAGFTLADVPTEWAAFWSFWCTRFSRRCARLSAEMTSGLSACLCRPPLPSTPMSSSSNFSSRTTRPGSAATGGSRSTIPRSAKE